MRLACILYYTCREYYKVRERVHAKRASLLHMCGMFTHWRTYRRGVVVVVVLLHVMQSSWRSAELTSTVAPYFHTRKHECTHTEPYTFERYADGRVRSSSGDDVHTPKYVVVRR